MDSRRTVPSRKLFSVLFVPSCTQRAPATRVRVHQYLPYLKSRGIKVLVLPILSDSTTRHMLISPTLGPFRRVVFYIRIMLEKLLRLTLVLWTASEYDVVFLQRTTFPFGGERLLAAVNPRIIYDFDDSIFMADPETTEWWPITKMKQAAKSREFAAILRVSRIAIADSEPLVEQASIFCRKCILLQGPIDTGRYRYRPRKRSGQVTIGWIGSPSTAGYLKSFKNVFYELHRVYDVKIKLIGAGTRALGGDYITSVDWNPETEVEELQTFDIGVMPMPNNEWTRGKLGYKMLQYMAVGVPPVASYTETTARIIVDGRNGLMVRDETQWFDKLAYLCQDSAARARMGSAARNTVEEKCSLHANAPKLLEVLETLGSEKSR